MTQLLKGAPVADSLNESLVKQVTALEKSGVTPTLAILRVGEREDDIAYERGAVKRCEKVGVAVKKIVLPVDVTQADLICSVKGLNADDKVHGVLLFRPLPPHLDEDAICNTLDPAKDVDGITDLSCAGVFAGKDLGYPPCTPQACMEILDYYSIDPTGKKAVVIGRSLVVGKPAAMMLTKRNATVTLCHTRTQDMATLCREANIIIVAAGRAEVIDSGYFAPGQTVLDVGINVDDEGKLVGDVNFAEAEDIVAAITPVPGGVGTVTTSVLVAHVVAAAEKVAARK